MINTRLFFPSRGRPSRDWVWFRCLRRPSLRKAACLSNSRQARDAAAGGGRVCICAHRFHCWGHPGPGRCPFRKICLLPRSRLTVPGFRRFVFGLKAPAGWCEILAALCPNLQATDPGGELPRWRASAQARMSFRTRYRYHLRRALVNDLFAARRAPVQWFRGNLKHGLKVRLSRVLVLITLKAHADA